MSIVFIDIFIYKCYYLTKGVDMVIKINVSELLGKHKMSKRQLALKAGIRPNTVNAYYMETVKRIEVEHLEAMCKVFNCQPGDILEYIDTKAEVASEILQHIDKFNRDPAYRDECRKAQAQEIVDMDKK